VRIIGIEVAVNDGITNAFVFLNITIITMAAMMRFMVFIVVVRTKSGGYATRSEAIEIALH
jgi:hypothetical protein